MGNLVLETKDLTKRYGNFVAVDHLNLAVHEGEVFGLLGPNGAGKTTTILMLLGLTEPTGGQVRVLGLDPSRQPLRVKAHVGYMPDQVGFYDELSARENLAYIAKLNAMARKEIDRRIDDLPTNLPGVTFEQSGNSLTIETLGHLDELLPWLARSGARNVQVDRVGLRAVYDRYHGPMEREVV